MENREALKSLTLEETLRAYKTNSAKGLDKGEIADRQKKYGLNEVAEKKTSRLLLFLKHFWGLTAWMLEATVMLSFILQKYFDAWLILGLLLFNGFIGFIQEQKAARTVETLKKKLEVMVRVLRSGEWILIAARELVPGDIVRIRTGDFLSADMKVIRGEVMLDQSALTGETTLQKAQPNQFLYGGAVVKSGECTAVVILTGKETFFGKTVSLVITARHKLHMEEIVGRVVRILFAIVVTMLSITLIVSLLRGESFISVLPLVLILLVSAIPVGLPAMFTISMARGSRDLAEKGLLVSRLSATEDAATLTTLFTDKTGTITMNLLSIQEVTSFGNFSKGDVLRLGALASEPSNADPIDSAFFKSLEEKGIALTEYEQISFIPFEVATKRTEAIVRHQNNSFKVLKGSYTSIKTFCKVDSLAVDETVEAWAHKGFKTIAVAKQDAAAVLLVGIVALYDPPRPDSQEIIKQIKELGIDVKMLTGDALPIATEIARQTGIGNKLASISELRTMFSDVNESNKSIHEHSGYAEVLPEDKFLIVKNLQGEKQIVGMTGDGVNDAPALKQAEVGIAVMGATDVAKQAASIILLKEGLRQIVELIKVGRVIHTRISNYTVNKIAKTIQTVLFVSTAYLLTHSFVVGPIDMVLMLFLIDFVVLALATDKVQGSRKPEKWEIRPLVQKGLIIGIALVIESLLWLLFGRNYFSIQNVETLHSFGFCILFYSSITAVLVVRSKQRFYREPIGKLLIAVILADILIVIALLSVGFKGFAQLPIGAILFTLLYFLVCNLLINDSLKVIVARKLNIR